MENARIKPIVTFDIIKMITKEPMTYPTINQQ